MATIWAQSIYWLFQVIPGLTIKAGTRVDIPIYLAHHNPDFFPQPETFKPERFLKNSGGNNIKPFTFRPFGGRSSIC